VFFRVNNRCQFLGFRNHPWTFFWCASLSKLDSVLEGLRSTPWSFFRAIIILTQNKEGRPVWAFPDIRKVVHSEMVLNRLKLRAKHEQKISHGTLGGDGFICFSKIIQDFLKPIIIGIHWFSGSSFQRPLKFCSLSCYNLRDIFRFVNMY